MATPAVAIDERTIETERLETHIYEVGTPTDDPVVLLHGNVSSGAFWNRLQSILAEEYYVVAPDLRGYGGSESVPVDATAGLSPFAQDVRELIETLGLEAPHLVGWSLGGGVAMRYAIESPSAVADVTLINPVSPYGFGGTHRDGTPCQPDFAGTGAGLTNDDFVARLRDGDTSADAETSPRSILRSFYVGETEIDERDEDIYVEGMVAMAIGDDHYPGDTVESTNWPGVAPGTRGVNNAISPKYCDLTGLLDIDPKPRIHWIRGGQDQIVSDQSFFDAGTLGKLGQLPDWPGEDEFPPQPMVTQTRDVFDSYDAAGGDVEETVFDALGHGPHLERPEAVAGAMREWWR